jgi:antitoxin VapB
VYCMALNIKNEETQKLAHELSKLTGESMTAAVTEAVRERLDRLRSAQDAGLAARILKIGKDCAGHLKEPYRSIDHGDLLYDEKGMPR